MVAATIRQMDDELLADDQHDFNPLVRLTVVERFDQLVRTVRFIQAGRRAVAISVGGASGTDG